MEVKNHIIVTEICGQCREEIYVGPRVLIKPCIFVAVSF